MAADTGSLRILGAGIGILEDDGCLSASAVALQNNPSFRSLAADHERRRSERFASSGGRVNPNIDY